MMASVRSGQAVRGEWSIGARVVGRPIGWEVAFYTELPSDLRPVTVRVLALSPLPLRCWREEAFMLPVEAVERLRDALSAYPNLVPQSPFRGFDGIGVTLGVRRRSGPLPDERTYDFAMLGDADSPVPAVRLVCGALEPWWREERRKMGIEPDPHVPRHG